MNILKAFEIGNLDVYPPIVLAPLAGFTDSSFRQMVKSFGAGLVYTEMISSMGIFYKDKKTLDIAHYNELEKPIGAQVFGSDPEKLAYAAAFLEGRGFDTIDINMGCPALKVVKNGTGGALLKDKERIMMILRQIRAAIKIPFTIKIRKGFNRGEDVAKEIGNIAEGEGVDAIIIHGITVREGFYREAEDWNSIKDLKKSVRMPVIGNGGIKTEEDVKKMFEKTEADGVMVGRAVLGAPWFIASSAQFVEKGTKIRFSLKEKKYIIMRHINLVVEEKGERGVKEMRKLLPFYIKGTRNASHFRNIINKVQSKDDLDRIL
ncbi:MAG: tRNA dihydrouridine synthase DusB, partial [Caldisericota bacterium]|nr:tRNA dihydrouridine synthase DusB [Caldisericota bacterium]